MCPDQTKPTFYFVWLQFVLEFVHSAIFVRSHKRECSTHRMVLWWLDEKVRDYETVTKHLLYKSVMEIICFQSSIQVHPSGVLTSCLSVKHSAEPSIKFVSSMNGRMENSCLYQNRDQSRFFVNKDHEQIIYSRVETAVIASS